MKFLDIEITLRGNILNTYYNKKLKQRLIGKKGRVNEWILKRKQERNQHKNGMRKERLVHSARNKSLKEKRT